MPDDSVDHDEAPTTPPADKDAGAAPEADEATQEAASRLDKILAEVRATREQLGPDAHQGKFKSEFLDDARHFINGVHPDCRHLDSREQKQRAILSLVLWTEAFDDPSGC